MKKEYIKPTVEIVRIHATTLLTTSTPDTEDLNIFDNDIDETL